MPAWVTDVIDHIVICSLLVLAAAVVVALWVMTYPETPFISELCYAGTYTKVFITLPVFGNGLCMLALNDLLTKAALGGVSLHVITHGAGAALQRLTARRVR